MIDKRMTLQEAVARVRDGDTVGIGGFAMARKPLALVRELARSPARDLTLVALGGLDVDLLIGLGRVKKLVFPGVNLEGFGTPGSFRRARQEGALQAMELSEFMFQAGLRAAAERLPFYPTRSGLGTDFLKLGNIQTFNAPYTGETLVAMPALRCDVTFLQVHAADPSGYGLILGPEGFDLWMAQGSSQVFLCAERVVPLEELKEDLEHIKVLRVWVTGVVEASFGGHPGSLYREYGLDRAHISEYGNASLKPDAFKDYVDRFVFGVRDHADYLKLIGEERLAQLRREA